MKKIILLILCLFSLMSSRAQDFGLSFSYFLPKYGDFSTPISPFSIRGLGVDLTRYLALETGASLYRMSGLTMKGLPFRSKGALVGPNFTILVPVEVVVQFKGAIVAFDIKGGVFGFYGFSQKLNYGNLDRAIKKYEDWVVVNSAFHYDNKPGWGYHAGMELTVYVKPQVGISLESNYLVGASALPLRGNYTGGSDVIQTKVANYPDAQIDLTGVEVSIGVIFTSGGGAPKGAKKQRRR